MSVAKRFRRLLGFLGVGGTEGSRLSNADIAQVVPDVALSTDAPGNTVHAFQVVPEAVIGIEAPGNTVHAFQVVADLMWQNDPTPTRPAQVVVEVLRSFHCVISHTVPPVPICPPLVAESAATPGCITTETAVNPEAPGCVTPLGVS
jgi:hypothetical protein